jgi:hypothetical protein
MLDQLETRFPDAPRWVRRLPVDRRGYPVPWFVAWIDGAPDFRVIRPRGIETAVKANLCWICGRTMGRLKSFVIGPMCVINRISSEPPSHPECATFAATACPFLTHPLARRGEGPMPEGASGPAGIMNPRNPGVAVVWSTLRFALAPDRGGVLFNVGRPHRLAWYAHGREATRAECEASMLSGLPSLQALAQSDGAEALGDLAAKLAEAWALLPAPCRGGDDG